MTQTAVSSGSLGAAGPVASFPPVKPRWLTPTTALLVTLAHICVALLLMTARLQQISPLDAGISVDLIPEGDTMESEEAAAMEISQPQPQEPQQAELAIPAPQLMTPDAVPLPLKEDTVEPRKRVERKDEAPPSDRRQEASERHRLGVKGGRATAMTRAGYLGLLAAAIARHVPSVTSLGPGKASCSFHVGPGGGMDGVSCSGSTSSHASLLRSAIHATRAPPPPNGSIFAHQTVQFH